MAFLHAYTDDSASEKGDRRLFLAGYLNRAENWARFSEAWDEELRAAPSIDYLKMAEANYFKEQFRGWSKEARDDKLRSLARVIRHFRPMSFQFSIDRGPYESLVKPVSPRGLGNPHFVACFGIVAAMARYADDQKITVPIDFIFDQQDGVDSDIRLFFDNMKRSLPESARKLIRGVPTFEDEKDRRFLPLQAADMLAWHIRREHEDCAPGEPLPMADLLRNPDGHLATQVEEPMMQKWAEHHSQLPGIPSLQSKAQWRAIKGEIARLISLGIDPATLGRDRNVFQKVRQRIGRLFKRPAR